jgi:hypothetical protein
MAAIMKVVYRKLAKYQPEIDWLVKLTKQGATSIVNFGWQCLRAMNSTIYRAIIVHKQVSS